MLESVTCGIVSTQSYWKKSKIPQVAHSNVGVGPYIC